MNKSDTNRFGIIEAMRDEFNKSMSNWLPRSGGIGATFTKVCICACSVISWYSCQVVGAGISERDKQAVVRIETPDGRLGTGFVLADSALGCMLVTNKHVIQYKQEGHFCDSVFLRKNRLSPNGKVIASQERSVLYLHYQGRSPFVLHPDPNIDIALIALGDNFKNSGDSITGFVMTYLADRPRVLNIPISDGSPVQLIGFSFQAPQSQQFHLSRFGNIGMFSDQALTLLINMPLGDSTSVRALNSEWIVVDVVSRPGDSGGPVIAWIPGQPHYWLAGIMLASNSVDGFTLVQPSYYILDLVNAIKLAN